MWELDPGVSEGSHIHGDEGALEELYYFLKGDGVMWVEDEEVPVSAGDAVLVPDGIDHGFRNTGSEPLRLVLIWGKPVETEDEAGMRYRLGVDVGGTFTDLVLYDVETNEIEVTKTPSTPANQAEGVTTGIGMLVNRAGNTRRRNRLSSYMGRRWPRTRCSSARALRRR